VELTWRNSSHNGAYHNLYNVEKYEMIKHFKVEENVNDSAVACMKVLHLERGNKVNCNLGNSFSVHDMKLEYLGYKQGALSQDLTSSVLQQGGK
jgi:hypothetical protein